MATRIRLRRVGRKRQASFRIVVAGSMHANSGRVTETIGKYNPRTNPSYIEVDEARALHWLREGAEMSESVRPLFRQVGILEKYAKGVEPEGSVVQGDPKGKTILATRPAAAKSVPATEEEPAAKPEKESKPKAKAKEEPEPEAKAEPAKAEEEPKAAATAEPAGEAAAEEQPKAEAKKGGKARAKGKKEGAEEPAASEAEDEEEKSES